MDFMKGIDYSLRDYQSEIIRNIISNVDNGNRMQTVLLPNAGGKTTMSFILSIMYTEQGKKVLYYSEEQMDVYYAARAIRTEQKRFKKVDFGCPKNIKSLLNNHYDIVITDAIHASFSSDVLKDFENRIRTINIDEIEKTNDTASTAQKSLIALHYLQEMIERDNAAVISFELNRMEDIGYAPIIAAPHILTYKMSREDQLKYGWSCAEQFETVSKKKMQAIEEFGISSPTVKKYDSALELVLKKLDDGFSSVETKLDNLQNDVSQILSIVTEVNNAVKSNKDILGMYFSVHDEEDLESDLFISKLVEKMTKELAGKLTGFENQEKYQRVKKLVLVRLGDDVWSKLEEESQKFLITAKFMFMQNMDLSEDIDYSSICLLSSKAFEVELAKRFVIQYEAYLTKKKIPESKWPKGILVYNKKENTYRKMDEGDFTLGSCPYIMGIYGSGNDKKESAKYFADYCRDELFVATSKADVTGKIKEFNKYIEYVREHYRNPAAHKSTMTMSEASECLDYILEIERVLKIMLEQFVN